MILTPNQALLYECVQAIQGRFTTLAKIAQAIQVSVDTLRSGLHKLRKIGLVCWSSENIGGQNGIRVSTLQAPYVVRGNRGFLQEKLAHLDPTQLALHPGPADENPHVVHQVVHQVESSSCSSSIKKQLLQELIFEDAFAHVNPQSLLPHLTHIQTAEEVQEFLDMANACIAAGHAGHGKPIQNPQGFLIAQLKAGYINPPKGYQSRRVRAQEMRNQQLQAELVELQRLQAEEERLRLELFTARLSSDHQDLLDREARARLNRRSPVSAERQIEIAREEILQEWFETGSPLAPDESGRFLGSPAEPRADAG